jgi:hypothetical protein
MQEIPPLSLVTFEFKSWKMKPKRVGDKELFTKEGTSKYSNDNVASIKTE